MRFANVGTRQPQLERTSVIVRGEVTGIHGTERITRRVMWSWKLRDARAVLMRVSDLGPA